MNILVVPSWYKTKTNKTLGSFFFEQAKALQKLGHTVIIADATLHGFRDYLSSCYCLNKYIDEGITVYSYNCPSFGRFRLDNMGFNAYYKNLLKIYRCILKDEIKIDIIHAHSYLPAGLSALKLGEEEKIPVVITEHSSDVIIGALNEKRKEYLKKAVNSSSKFISVSNALDNAIKNLVSVNEGNMMVIPNIVNDIFGLNESNGRSGYRYVSVGNLIEIKRFDLTIKAFALAFAGKEGFFLDIAGEGYLRKELEKLVRELKVEKQVHFKGRISRKEIAILLSESDCFVLPSDFETFGVAYIEALSSGLPVIGTKNGGAEDIINKENGILIKKNDLLELKTAMENIYKNRNNYDKQKISSDAITRYGELQVGKKIEDVYKLYVNK